MLVVHEKSRGLESQQQPSDLVRIMLGLVVRMGRASFRREHGTDRLPGVCAGTLRTSTLTTSTLSNLLKKTLPIKLRLTKWNS